MLPDQTITLNESWLCFINRGENIRTADTNNFLIFISYSSFKVRFISQCNLHLKSRTRAVKLQKKSLYILEFSKKQFCCFSYISTYKKFNLKSAFICFSTKWTNTMHISQFFFLSFLLANWFSWMIRNWFFPRMSQYFKTLLSTFLFYFTGTLDINLNIKWN